MEEKIIIKLKDKELTDKLRLIRKSKINLTELFCRWLTEYTLK